MPGVTTPGLIFASNKAIIAARKHIAKARMFSTDFSADAAQPGTTLKVPVYTGAPATVFNATSNNYETVDGTVTWASITFNNHYKSTFEITDKQMLEFNASSFWANCGEAQGRAIGLSIEAVIGGLFNSTNVTASYSLGASGAAITKKAVASIRTKSAAVGADPARSVLLLSPAIFAEVLSLLDSNVYGGAQAIRDGMVEGLYGYKAVMECSALGSGIAGVCVPDDAVAIASRLISVGSPAIYQEFGSTTDPDSGFVLGVRRHGSPATGTNYGTMECLFGAALVQPTKCFLITQTTQSQS